MKKINWIQILISCIIAFVVCYFIYSKEEGITQENILINAAGGAGGMLIGMLIYQRFFKEEK